MDYTIEEKAMFMREALKEAEIALANDEIPIGCVLVKDGQKTSQVSATWMSFQKMPATMSAVSVN